MTNVVGVIRALKLAGFFALALAAAGCANKPNDPSQAGAGNASPGSPQDFVVNVGDRVFFESDSSELTPQSTTTLEKQVKWLQAYSQYTFTVEGHADERGTREYNIALGQRRAEGVKRMLVLMGATDSQVEPVSLGEEKPKCAEHAEGCWSQNRRSDMLYGGEY